MNCVDNCFDVFVRWAGVEYWRGVEHWLQRVVVVSLGGLCVNQSTDEESVRVVQGFIVRQLLVIRGHGCCLEVCPCFARDYARICQVNISAIPSAVGDVEILWKFRC